jgi:signal transduction histidine kinase
MEAQRLTAPFAVSWNGSALTLAAFGAPVAVVDTLGRVVGLSPQARELLVSIGIAPNSSPFPLPESLWAELSVATEGDAIEWQPASGEPGAWLGCTRYSLGVDHSVILMRETSAKRAELHRRLHKQRLESTGRLIASIAHDVRSSVASILYNADWMASSSSSLPTVELVDTVAEIQSAGRRLQSIVDRLLDFAKLGPPVSADISVREVLRRVTALVRPAYRGHDHTLVTRVHEDADSVRGNGLIIDQVLVNLLINASEASERGLTVTISTELAHATIDGAAVSGPRQVRIIVEDDGPGIPDGVRARVFQPFFTTRPQGTGLGLTTAREAARDLGGDLVLEPSSGGARFVLSLPAGRLKGEGGR